MFKIDKFVEREKGLERKYTKLGYAVGSIFMVLVAILVFLWDFLLTIVDGLIILMVVLVAAMIVGTFGGVSSAHKDVVLFIENEKWSELTMDLTSEEKFVIVLAMDGLLECRPRHGWKPTKYDDRMCDIKIRLLKKFKSDLGMKDD